MTKCLRPLEVAIDLMRMALALLDEAGESGAAARLQSAIDTANKVPVLRPGEEVDPKLAAQIPRKDR